jgi:hypothetical protein
VPNIQDNEGADMLRDRRLFVTVTALCTGGEMLESGGKGSFMNSGRVRIVSGSVCCMPMGTDSRMNSGKLNRASGSFVRDGLRTAS